MAQACPTSPTTKRIGLLYERGRNELTQLHDDNATNSSRQSQSTRSKRVAFRWRGDWLRISPLQSSRIPVKGRHVGDFGRSATGMGARSGPAGQRRATLAAISRAQDCVP